MGDLFGPRDHSVRNSRQDLGWGLRAGGGLRALAFSVLVRARTRRAGWRQDPGWAGPPPMSSSCITAGVKVHPSIQSSGFPHSSSRRAWKRADSKSVAGDGSVRAVPSWASGDLGLQ